MVVSEVIIEKCQRNEVGSLYDFLLRIDSAFTPPLSEKRNLKEYAVKILDLGNVIVAKKDGLIIGAIGYYTNDVENLKSYVPLVGVDQRYKCQHVATKLVQRMIEHVSSLNFTTIGLHTNNIVARHIYEKNGFTVLFSEGSSPNRYYLEKKI